jgi:hypothetical protein
MNCKQGDLAIIVEGLQAGNIVRCVSRYDGPWAGVPYAPGWIVDRHLINRCGRFQNAVGDCALRPIRDNDGEDEMLRIAGKPREVETQ